MTTNLSLDDQLLKQLHETGEVRVEDTHGVRIVLMTVDAREQLGLVYDDSEWTPEEMMAVVAQQLNDPEGWGHPDMDVYDEEYGQLIRTERGRRSVEATSSLLAFQNGGDSKSVSWWSCRTTPTTPASRI